MTSKGKSQLLAFLRLSITMLFIPGLNVGNTCVCNLAEHKTCVSLSKHLTKKQGMALSAFRASIHQLHKVHKQELLFLYLLKQYNLHSCCNSLSLGTFVLFKLQRTYWQALQRNWSGIVGTQLTKVIKTTYTSHKHQTLILVGKGLWQGHLQTPWHQTHFIGTLMKVLWPAGRVSHHRIPLLALFSKHFAW